MTATGSPTKERDPRTEVAPTPSLVSLYCPFCGEFGQKQVLGPGDVEWDEHLYRTATRHAAAFYIVECPECEGTFLVRQAEFVPDEED